jgi:glycosyltransferase involved in cell wall biosynthesis
VLSGLLVGTLTASLVATCALFLARARTLPGGMLPWSRRLLFALLGTVVLAALGAAAAYLLTEDRQTADVTFIVLVAASAVWLPVTRRWNARAHLCWSMNVILYASYLTFMLDWTFESPLGAAARVGALLLWGLEVLAGLLGTAYLWELCDALGREHWGRRSSSGVEATTAPGGSRPFVSLHVPAHEEPPEMVIETVASLLRIDYPSFEVVVIDDNTEDESLWRPVEQWCAEHGVTFAHLADWPGYKSGALNYALRELTDDRAEVIGIVDADYQVEPDFLSRCAPLFADPRLGFVQTPQDYREWDSSTFSRRLYYSYKYFFAVSQPSRNERDGAIFAGTMGLIRRQALEDLGGWDEWCITEDAELSLRLLRSGWSGLHVDASFGHGVMPLTFEALKGQRSLLPGRRGQGLSGGQRWAYLSGGIQWYGDLLGVLFFLFLLAGAANIAFAGGLLFRKLTAFLLAAIPLLVLLGFLRAVALIRRGTGAPWRDAMGAFLIWQSTTLVVARASVQALFAKKAEFLRTPKEGEGASLWRAITGNRWEVLLALLGLIGIGIGIAHIDTAAGVVTAGLLLIPTVAFASAPWHEVMASKAALSPVLVSRRAAEGRRDYYTRARAATGAGLALVGAMAAVVVGLVGIGGDDVAPPRLRPEPGPAAPAPTEPSGSSDVDPTEGGSSESPTSTSTTESPTASPAETPTGSPTGSPTASPTESPTESPTAGLTDGPSPTDATSEPSG